MKTNCSLCPRQCNKFSHENFCKVQNLKISKVMLHYFEEPLISCKNGSGAIFFSGCNLECCFCQNHEISRGMGVEISENDLEKIIFNLEEVGAENINFVSPSHFSHSIIKVLRKIKHKLTIPVVYNTNSYERIEVIKALSGLVDVYLPDLKFFSSELSLKYANCSDCFSVAFGATSEMINQQKLKIEQGKIKKGVIVRHLVLPSHYADSCEILKRLGERFGGDDFLLSLMSQFIPCHESYKFKEINRKLFTAEYDKVRRCAEEFGFLGFCQERTSASSDFVPNFQEFELKKWLK